MYDIYCHDIALNITKKVTQNEVVDWEDVYSFYGEMADEVRKLNFSENVIDDVYIESI